MRGLKIIGLDSILEQVSLSPDLHERAQDNGSEGNHGKASTITYILERGKDHGPGGINRISVPIP